MESPNVDTAAAATEQGAAIPSFADQLAAHASAGPTTDQPRQQAAPTEVPPKPAEQAGTPPDPNAAPAWLQELGTDFKTADEVKQRLARVKELEGNQLTDELKTSLRLLNEPEVRREYLKLLDTDYTAMDDEAMLLHDFRAQNPTLSAEDVELLFQESQDAKYPGLANEEGDPLRRAHSNKRKAEADQVRARYTTEKDAKLGEFQKGAQQQTGPSAEELTKTRDAHLDQVKNLIGKGADDFKLTVNVNGAPLNLAVEAGDLPAIQAVMENPYAALANEDGTPNYPALREFATIKALFPKLLAQAQKAGLEGQGAVVTLDELHNGGPGSNPNQRPTQTPSFAEQLQKASGGAGAPARLNY